MEKEFKHNVKDIFDSFIKTKNELDLLNNKLLKFKDDEDEDISSFYHEIDFLKEIYNDLFIMFKDYNEFYNG